MVRNLQQKKPHQQLNKAEEEGSHRCLGSQKILYKKL